MSMYSETVKQAQFQPGQKRVRPKNLAYPRYDRSLVSQRHKNPVREGIVRGTGTGITGMALGALIARVISSRPSAGVVAAGGALGGIVGAIPGYLSGKQEAESENSKLLFLRRRLGINEPGELETALQNPQLTRIMAENKELDRIKAAESTFEKRAWPKLTALLKALGKSGAGKAVGSTAGRAVIGGTAGGVAGKYWGYDISPRVSGYDDVESTRRISGASGVMMSALLGALLAVGGKKGLKPDSWVGKMVKHVKRPAIGWGALASYPGMELLFSGHAALSRHSDAVRAQAAAAVDQAAATADQAAKQVAPAVHRALTSNTGRGALAGTALAGLGGLATGLTRARTDDEIRKDKSRMDMVKSDILKYVVPLAVGGGVVGSVVK